MTPPEPFVSLTKRQCETVLQGIETPSLLYLHDPNANLCRLIEPIVTRHCKQKLTGVKCYGLDVKENKDLTFELNVTQAPAFVIYHRGNEIRRLTNIDYDEGFETTFGEFLVGDFLFDKSPYNVLEEVNFFSELKDWHQYNLVAFMEPSDPINWQLETVLEEFQRKKSNYIRSHLVNSNQNSSLLSHYKIKTLPAVILFQESDEVKRWHPAASPDKIKRECENFIENQSSI
ncbi:MAG: thioredoxin domain-containing protein [bacterium]